MTLVERLRYLCADDREPRDNLIWQAADRIEQLEAQVETLSVDWSVMVSRCEKLEAALREIERGVPIHTASNIARRALEDYWEMMLLAVFLGGLFGLLIAIIRGGLGDAS